MIATIVLPSNDSTGDLFNFKRSKKTTHRWFNC